MKDNTIIYTLIYYAKAAITRLFFFSLLAGFVWFFIILAALIENI